MVLDIFSVVGAKEQENNTVNVRTRDNKIHNEHSVDFVIERFQYLKNNRVLNAEDIFVEKDEVKEEKKEEVKEEVKEEKKD